MRLLFDSKANLTETFLKLKLHQKRHDNSTTFYNYLENFKSYILNKPLFLKKYIHLLPLANNLGQTSWSDEEINEYLYSGSLPVLKGELMKVYNTMLEKAENNTFLYSFTNHWLNKDNLNFFLSIYGHVISRTFQLYLKDYDNIDKFKNYINDDNLYLNTFGGNILIPFIDLCNHYHPKLLKTVNQVDKQNIEESLSAKLKLIKFKIAGSNVKIMALSRYTKKTEFAFSYSTMLNNDYLLLNYGFIVKNNPFQEFIFRFDIDDPYKEFYKKLKEINFNMEKVKLLPNNKLATHFSISSDVLSDDLFFFIDTYLSMNPPKFNRRKPNLMNNEIKLSKVRALVLYLLTLNRNLYSIFPKDYDEGFKKLVVDLHLNSDSINKLDSEITKNELNSNGNSDVSTFLNFKYLHTSLKQRNIRQFNFDNIKLIYKHKDIVQTNIRQLIMSDIGLLRNEYIKTDNK